MRYTATSRASSYGKRLAFCRTSRIAYRYALRRRKTLTEILNDGGIAVIPTDTLYGIVARAQDRCAVRRLYRLRRGAARKPFIILIASMSALREFGIAPTVAEKRFLQTVWPGKLSVIFSCSSPRFAYLRRGAQTLAFRVPRPRTLRNFLRAVGPLVAPSANPEGRKPAETISEARRYFGNRVDFYHGAGRRISGKPSTIISFVGKTAQIIRQGAVRVSASML